MSDKISGNTDVHVRHRTLLAGQCPISDTYLQPCLWEFLIRVTDSNWLQMSSDRSTLQEYTRRADTSN